MPGLVKRCRESGEEFRIDQRDLEFYSRVSPVIGGTRLEVPPPTLCPAKRLQRRLAFRNQFYVLSRPSSFSGKPIFSVFPASSPFPVIEKDEWWSDRFDALQYGRSIDFTRPFFEQFFELRDTVPHCATTGVGFENSDYCSHGAYIKDCYLCFNTLRSEQCMYSEHTWWSQDCVDCTYCRKCELCFDCSACEQCYNLQSSQDCESCSDSYFLLNCRACSNCFGCANLHNAKYCLYNRQVTQQEYRAFLDSLQLSSYRVRCDLARQAHTFWRTQPRPHVQSKRADACTGNYLTECRDVTDSFFLSQAESVRYGYALGDGVNDCYDFSIAGVKAERIYEAAMAAVNVSNVLFSFWTIDGCSNLLYCWQCVHSTDSFGSVGLKRQNYCILNTQYSPSEYARLAVKLADHMRQTGEWGEFFPMRYAASPYNFSLAQRYFPQSESEVRSLGLWWEHQATVADPRESSAAPLPDGLPEEDLPITAASDLSGKVFRITKEELRRYRQFNVPLPRRAYNERMAERAALLGPMKLTEAKCKRSGKQIFTSIPAQDGWQVWDRETYDQEMS